MWMIHTYFEKLLEIFFPPSCISCRKEGHQVCNDCLVRLHRAINTPHLFIHSTFSFKDPVVKKIIHSIKYYHRKDLIIPLAKILTAEIKSSVTRYTGILVPIPMPKARKYIRGYNQAEEIAKVLSSTLELPMRTNVLMRTGTTQRQVEASTRGARLANQKNAFLVSDQVQDLDIILVDDVTTTGATILEARKILLHHGAHSVVAVTLAH
jgi:ComF family protein